MSQAAASPSAVAPGAAPGLPPLALWINLFIASLLMLATLPGRTHGLGLITEPLLKDLALSHVDYADINLWATLGGALLCLPVGYLIDHIGLRAVAVGLLVGLGLTVWRLSDATGGYWALFTLILLTRAFGQSGLSVVSISAASTAARSRYGMMMGIYSVVLTLLFFGVFGELKVLIPAYGWRACWLDIALALLFVIAPITLLLLREQRGGGVAPVARASDPPGPATGHTLLQALATPTFWIFACAVSLYGLVSSGLGLFAQSVLTERGLEAKAIYDFYQNGAIASLVGQGLCAWLALRYPLHRLLTAAMAVYAVALAMLPLISSMPLFHVFVALSGLAGGFIAVLFYAVWKPAFGQAQLGRIQGAAQFLTVVFSANGPEVFARCQVYAGSYAPVLFALAMAVALLGIAAWRVRMPKSA